MSDENLFVAGVSSVSEGGAALILPGTTAATQKLYKKLDAASSLSAGDRVLCARVSGTIIIIDKIG